MPIIRDEAVVLGRLDYSESSQVLVLFTREHGKVRAIAKGVRRGTKTRFAVGIDLLEVGSVVLSSRQERGEALATLTEWKQARALSGLRERLSRLNAAQYAAEIAARLTEDWDPAPRLYEALTETLSALCETNDPLAPTIACQQAVLAAVGAFPRFDSCVDCGRREDLTHFSSFDGGLVCRHCEPTRVEKRAVSKATVALLRNTWGGGEAHSGRARAEATRPAVGSASGGVRAGAKDNGPGSLTGIFSLLNYHIAHLMGREPVMGAHVVPQVQQRRIH